MGKGPEAPQPPDYVGAAKAQGDANLAAARSTAMLSNPNINNPYGSQTVSYQGDIPTVNQTLNPTAQATLDQQQQAGLGLATTAADRARQLQTHLSSQMPETGLPVTQL